MKGIIYKLALGVVATYLGLAPSLRAETVTVRGHVLPHNGIMHSHVTAGRDVTVWVRTTELKQDTNGCYVCQPAKHALYSTPTNAYGYVEVDVTIPTCEHDNAGNTYYDKEIRHVLACLPVHAQAFKVVTSSFGSFIITDADVAVMTGASGAGTADTEEPEAPGFMTYGVVMMGAKSAQ